MSVGTVRPALAYAMLVLVMLLWAAGVVVARGVHELASPIAFSFWRWFTALSLLTPLALRQMRPHMEYIRAHARDFALLGLFMAGGSTLLVGSVQYTSATNAALVSATQPIVTVVVAWFLLHERLNRYQILGITSAMLGVLAMVMRMDIEALIALDINPGDGLVLLAVVFYAFYSINLHRWIGALPALVTMYLTCAGGLVTLLPFYVVDTLVRAPIVIEPVLVAGVIFMAIVPTIVATTLWNMSVGAVGPSKASVFINLLPVFGTALAVAVLGETLHAYHIVGSLLACTGITLVVVGGRK